jgi:hypothetical protein
MRKVFSRYIGRSSLSITAAIALSVGTVYLSYKGEMEAAMGAAGAAVAAFTASAIKDPEEKEEISKKVLDYQTRMMMLDLAARSNDPALLSQTIAKILELQQIESRETFERRMELKSEIREELKRLRGSDEDQS